MILLRQGGLGGCLRVVVRWIWGKLRGEWRGLGGMVARQIGRSSAQSRVIDSSRGASRISKTGES